MMGVAPFVIFLFVTILTFVAADKSGDWLPFEHFLGAGDKVHLKKVSRDGKGNYDGGDKSGY